MRLWVTGIAGNAGLDTSLKGEEADKLLVKVTTFSNFVYGYGYCFECNVPT